MRVLLIEDDDGIADPLTRGLRRDGFDVHRSNDGAGGLLAATTEPFDVVLLDLGLPGIDGYEVCRRIREQLDVPIIVITARGEEMDRVFGLELGADDYVVKPFGFRELIARIRAVTRRRMRSPEPEPEPLIVHDGLEVDARTRRVFVDGREIALTRKEFDLLLLLARDPGATCTRQQILESVWDPHWYGPTKTLDVHIASLRKKLGKPDLIETVRGVGFRLDGSRAGRPDGALRATARERS